MLKRRKPDDDFDKRLTAVEKSTEKMKARLLALEIEARIFKPKEPDGR